MLITAPPKPLLKVANPLFQLKLELIKIIGEMELAIFPLIIKLVAETVDEKRPITLPDGDVLLRKKELLIITELDSIARLTLVLKVKLEDEMVREEEEEGEEEKRRMPLRFFVKEDEEMIEEAKMNPPRRVRAVPQF